MSEKKTDTHILIKKYFEEHSFIEANLLSFNNFIEKELQSIVDDI